MQASSPQAASAVRVTSEASTAAVLRYPLQPDQNGSLQFADFASCASLPYSAGADVVTHDLHAAHDRTPLDDYFKRLSLQEILPKPLMPGVPHGEPHAASLVSPRTID
eukprot:1122906-Amphidinium_carterae.1